MSTTYWDKLKEFQPYSFMLNSSGGVVRVADSTGAWLERHKVQELVDSADASLADAQAEIARLRGALEACQRYALEFPDSLLRDNLLDTAADALK